MMGDNACDHAVSRTSSTSNQGGSVHVSKLPPSFASLLQSCLSSCAFQVSWQYTRIAKGRKGQDIRIATISKRFETEFIGRVPQETGTGIRKGERKNSDQGSSAARPTKYESQVVIPVFAGEKRTSKQKRLTDRNGSGRNKIEDEVEGLSEMIAGINGEIQGEKK